MRDDDVHGTGQVLHNQAEPTLPSPRPMQASSPAILVLGGGVLRCGADVYCHGITPADPRQGIFSGKATANLDSCG